MAEDYPFIKVNLSGFTRYSKAKILWQREGETETHALGFENNDNVDIVIDSIEFRPFSAMRVAEQIFEDWTNPPPLAGLLQ